jgi:hypothetical protein
MDNLRFACATDDTARMRTSTACHTVAILVATGFGLAARDAHAQSSLRLLPRVQISDAASVTAGEVGDIEACVVGKDARDVLVSWVHIPVALHVSTESSVQSVRLAIDGTMSGIVNGDVVRPVLLALTRDSTGPIQIIGAPTDAMRWQLFAARPGMTGSTRLIVPTPAEPTGFDSVNGVREISVPRRIQGTASDENLPIGLVVESQALLSVRTVALGIDPSLVPSGGTSSTGSPIGPDNGTARAAYWGDRSGVALEQFAMQRAPFSMRGMANEVIEMLTTPATTKPAFTNARGGALRAVVSQPGAGLECRTYPSSGSTPVNCGAPEAAIDDLDADADEQYPGEVWFTGASGRASDTQYVFVGESRRPGALARLDTNGVAGCFHPRIAAVPGESLAMPQHAVVVANCTPTTGAAPRVFAWIVERSAVATDAGSDAEADATDDAMAMDDAATTEDAASAMDVATPSPDIQSVSFRGSGCTCRTESSRGGDARGGLRAAALFGLLVAMRTVRRRRSPSRCRSA